MLSILIPWRSIDPHRVRAWDYIRPHWERLNVQLCVAGDGRSEGQPFSLARAVNRARAMATGDTLAVFGADHLPPDAARLAWIADRLERLPWTGVYASTRIISPSGTARIVNGEDPAQVLWLGSHLIGMCEGVIAVRAAVWDDAAGMDERFEGWGAEDTAFKAVLRALYPGGGAGEGEVWTLWHPDRHGTAELTAANIARCTEYENAAREGRMREYLQEVRNGGAGS